MNVIKPSVIIIEGPNEAGKSTLVKQLVARGIKCVSPAKFADDEWDDSLELQRLGDAIDSMQADEVVVFDRAQLSTLVFAKRLRHVDMSQQVIEWERKYRDRILLVQVLPSDMRYASKQAGYNLINETVAFVNAFLASKIPPRQRLGFTYTEVANGQALDRIIHCVTAGCPRPISLDIITAVSRPADSQVQLDATKRLTTAIEELRRAYPAATITWRRVPTTRELTTAACKRNFGTRTTYGQLVMYIDDDDWIDSHGVQTAMWQFMTRPDIDAVCGAASLVNYHDIPDWLPAQLCPDILPTDESLQGPVNAIQSSYDVFSTHGCKPFLQRWIFRRSSFIDEPFMPHLVIGEDMEMIIAYLLSKEQHVYVTTQILGYYNRADSESLMNSLASSSYEKITHLHTRVVKALNSRPAINAVCRRNVDVEFALKTWEDKFIYMHDGAKEAVND